MFRALFGDGLDEAEFARLAKFADGAEQALRRARSAKGSAELHHGLVPVAGGARGEERVRGFLELLPALAGSELAADGAETGEDAGDVAVKDGAFFAVGDAQNCGGGVISDPGQSEGVFGVDRESAIVPGDDLPRGFLKMAGAGIVTETGPEAEYFFLRGFGERLDVRKAREEFFIVGDDGVDAGLLEHDFGQPDAVGVVGAAPRKIATEVGEPGEEIFAEEGECEAGEDRVRAAVPERGGAGRRKCFRGRGRAVYPPPRCGIRGGRCARERSTREW